MEKAGLSSRKFANTPQIMLYFASPLSLKISKKFSGYLVNAASREQSYHFLDKKISGIGKNYQTGGQKRCPSGVLLR